MMSDKQRADRLLKACEALYVQNLALRSLLQTAKVVGWPHMLDKILGSDLATQISAKFQEGYSQWIAEEEQKNLLEILERLPTDGLVH